MNRLTTLLFLAALLATTSSGCMLLGPDYRTPSASLQEEWLEAGDPLLDTTVPVAPEWWQGAFHDPVLDQLVAEALSQSLTLRSAGLRVLQARQQLMIAIGNQFPQQQQVTGQGGREGFLSSPSNEFYDLGFNLNWEVDIWGRFRRQIESASAALDASAAGYDGILVSLIADVARTYLLIRTTQQRLAVSQKNLVLQQESVRITTAKFEAGEVSALDVDQAQTLLYTTRASLAGLELSLQQSENSLAILLGRPPQDMRPFLGDVQAIPTITPEIAVGMPQDLIRRRPDIRQAERQLAAQSAQIGFAVTDLYPHLGIGGKIGSSVPSDRGGNYFSDLFKNKNIGYSGFGFFEWDIFNYGRLKNNVRLQDAVFQQFLEDYRQTVLQAQGEVENAIVAFLKSQEQLENFGLAAEAAQRATDISTEQYQDGLVDFNTVITTLRTLLAQQEQLVATQGTVATNLVDVYRALGGGWELREGKGPLDLIPEETRKEMLERTDYWDRTFRD